MSSNDRKISLPKFSWLEIQQHNNQKDCWIVIDQFIYDISPFIQKNQHPGGNVLAILAGEDASAMFYSNHFNTSKQHLQQYLIGEVKNEQPLFECYQDEFLKTLKHRVLKYFKDNKVNYRKTTHSYYQIFFTGLLLIASWLCIYLLPPWGLIATIPMGLATTSLIGSFAHEYIHGNILTKVSRIPGYWIVNNILWGIFIPFMPERYFQYEHIRHHNYPMHPDHDYDVFALKNIVRLSRNLSRKPYHALQHIYAPFSYGFYLVLQLIGGYNTTFFDNREILKDQGNVRDIIFSSLVAVSFHIAIPIYLTSVGWFLLAAGIYFFIWQAAIYISSGLPHMTETVPDKINNSDTGSWSRYVCATTKNLKSGNWFYHWVTGGLNHHLNHHLLPSIPQQHLQSITPIVQQTCEDFSYSYSNYASFRTYYIDHYLFLKSLGRAYPKKSIQRNE